MRNTLIIDPVFEGLEDEIVHWLGDGVKVGGVNFETFPDAWPKIFIDKVADDIEHREVTAVLDFSKPEKILGNIALCQSIVGYTADKLRLIIPFFPVGTMEREVERGDVATAKPLAKMLSTIGSGRNGKTSIHTFDIHDIRIKDFFGDNVNIELHTGMHLVDLDSYDGIIFPDKGALDRYGKYYDGMYKILCDKTRIDGQDEKIIVIKEGNPKGRNLLLVDDMIQGGGTGISTVEVVKKAGAESVSMWATHGVHPNESHKKVARKVKRLIVSDSVPDNTLRAEGTKKMTVESIAPLITRIISKG